MTDEEIAKICMDETGFDIDGYHLGAFAIADFARAIEAAAHGAGQRDKELLAVDDFEPINKYLAVEIDCIDAMYRGSPSYVHDGFTIMEKAKRLVEKCPPLYNETQLAAARLQGAKEAETRATTAVAQFQYLAKDQSVKHQQILDLELINQQLLAALELIATSVPSSGELAYCKGIARAAIAAALQGEQTSKRVPLTGEQIDEIYARVSDEYDKTAEGYESHNFSRAIEAAHGITGEQT